MLDIVKWVLIYIDVNLFVTMICPVTEAAMVRHAQYHPDLRHRMLWYSLLFGGILTASAWIMAYLQRPR